MGKEEADPDNIVEHAGYSDESAKELEQHKAINKLDVGKDFIEQQKYVKYMGQAAIVWEQFTGAGDAKNNFLKAQAAKKQEEDEAKAKEAKARKAAEKHRKAAMLKKKKLHSKVYSED